MKEADLLCGDAIINFKTVQSFGHEDLLVQKYTEWVDPVRKIAICGNIKTGFAFALSQVGNFVIQFMMFTLAA